MHLHAVIVLLFVSPVSFSCDIAIYSLYSFINARKINYVLC